MRIRTIKPEFWSSEDVAELDWDTRLLYVGLWSYVDDNGVGRDVEKLIVAELFPLEDDPRETLARVSRGLQTLSERGHITRYEVDGKPFLFVNAWDTHQRIDKPAKARYSRPTSENAPIRESVAKPSRECRDTLAPGTEEQGNRGTEEKDKDAHSARSFQAFWEIYPRKAEKRRAESAYRSALKRASPETIAAGAQRYRDDPGRVERFTKHPTTWLNGDCWDDPPVTSNVHTLPRNTIGILEIG